MGSIGLVSSLVVAHIRKLRSGQKKQAAKAYPVLAYFSQLDLTFNFVRNWMNPLVSQESNWGIGVDPASSSLLLHSRKGSTLKMKEKGTNIFLAPPIGLSLVHGAENQKEGLHGRFHVSPWWKKQRGGQCRLAKIFFRGFFRPIWKNHEGRFLSNNWKYEANVSERYPKCQKRTREHNPTRKWDKSILRTILWAGHTGCPSKENTPKQRYGIKDN